MREIFKAEPEGQRPIGAHDAAKFVQISGLAIGGEAHHFVFIAELPEAEILRERGVIHPQRMRESNFAQSVHVADLRQCAHMALAKSPRPSAESTAALSKGET